MKKKEITRCEWVQNKPDYYMDYHDNIWGKPEYEDQELFKWLSLEIFTLVYLGSWSYQNMTNLWRHLMILIFKQLLPMMKIK